jgi:hypothetical protein
LAVKVFYIPGNAAPIVAFSAISGDRDVNNSNSWVLPVCIGVGLAAYGASTVLTPDQKKGDAPPPLEPFVAAAAKDDKAPNADQQGPANADRPKKNDSSSAPRRQLILRRLNVPTELAPDKWGNSPFDVHDLAINSDGSRLITKSKKQVVCWDLVSGRPLQTFLGPKPAWDYMEPKADRVFMSPDTRFVASLSQNKNHEYSLELHEAETKRLIGAVVPDKNILLLDHMLPAFTPSGASLLLHGSGRGGGLGIQAVSIRNAVLTNVHCSTKGFKEGHVEALLVVPNEPTLILHRRGDKALFALDLRTGQETAITAITNKPWHLHFERGIDISADGRFVISAGIDHIQVCDWRANRQVLNHKESNVAYLQPHFTPDGKRFLFVRQPQYDLLYFGGAKSGVRETPPCTLELYDVASQGKLSEFTLDKDHTVKRITALALSQNGKVIAIANHTSVFCLDFQATFGVTPLPPLPRPASDGLPVK